MRDLYEAYMNDGRELLNSEYPDCSFYLHSTCVSITKNIFEDADSNCLPGCTEYSIHQESIHVSCFTTPILLSYSCRSNRKLDFCTMIVISLFKYTKLDEKNIQFLKSRRNSDRKMSSGIQLVELTIRMSENIGLNYDEKVDYSLRQAFKMI